MMNLVNYFCLVNSKVKANIGNGQIVFEPFCIIGHPLSDNSEPETIFEGKVHIRANSVIYCGSKFGNNFRTGHHVVVRENCNIGENVVIGTGVKVEMGTTIGDNTLIETQTHITGNMTIGKCCFFGACVVSCNDWSMLHNRKKPNGWACKGATIGDYVRVGSNAIIMPEVHIGNHAVICAGELVRKDVPEGKMLYKGRLITAKRQEFLC